MLENVWHGPQYPSHCETLEHVWHGPQYPSHCEMLEHVWHGPQYPSRCDAGACVTWPIISVTLWCWSMCDMAHNIRHAVMLEHVWHGPQYPSRCDAGACVTWPTISVTLWDAGASLQRLSSLAPLLSASVIAYKTGDKIALQGINRGYVMKRGKVSPYSD